MSHLNEYLPILRAATTVSEWRCAFQEYIQSISANISDDDYLSMVNEAYSTAVKFSATGSGIETDAILGSITDPVYERWVTILNNR